MKTFSKSHFEILFLKKLLNSEGFLGKGTPKRASEMSGFLLGFRKGSVVFDLEKLTLSSVLVMVYNSLAFEVRFSPLGLTTWIIFLGLSNI